jgi:hypothetical protein
MMQTSLEAVELFLATLDALDELDLGEGVDGGHGYKLEGYFIRQTQDVLPRIPVVACLGLFS